jgi:hypothetical protein
MKTLLVLVLIALGMSPAFGVECQRDALRHTVKTNYWPAPYLIITERGKHFRILGQDLINPAEWHEGDELSVCVDPQGANTFDVIDLRLNETLVTLGETKPPKVP